MKIPDSYHRWDEIFVVSAVLFYRRKTSSDGRNVNVVVELVASRFYLIVSRKTQIVDRLLLQLFLLLHPQVFLDDHKAADGVFHESYNHSDNKM